MTNDQPPEDPSATQAPPPGGSAPAVQKTPSRLGLETPGTHIGPYKLLQKLGEGGFGEVWMAAATEPVKRTVAIKLIKPGMDSGPILARFEAERQALALMDHPNIAKVFDMGTTEHGRPYFVMELVKGIPITNYCDDNRLTLRQRMELFIPVCQAIQHAHQKGIIHRDIKPSNVLVGDHEGKPAPKVIDFGLAKAMGQPLTDHSVFTSLGTRVGTLEYMSPEQTKTNALDVDTRTDIYSLGVLLYELLTGTTPLTRQRVRAGAMDELLRLVREEEAPKPSTRVSTWKEVDSIAAQRKIEPSKLRKMLRGEPEWILLKALEKDRTRRYDTAAGLARDIERHLRDEPVEAGPPSAVYLLKKLARKHRTPLTVGAVVLVTLVAAVIVSTWQAVRATRAEDDAKTAQANAEQSEESLKNVLHFLKQSEESAKRDRNKALIAEQDAKKAEATAKTALKEAERERQLAKEVSDFLIGAFRSPDPLRAGRDIKVVEILDEAKRELERKFKEAPRQKGSLYNALGQTYLGLGLKDDALDSFEKAQTLREKALGGDHPETLVSLNDLAEAYRAKGQLDIAIPLLKKTLDLRRAKLGANDPATLTSMNNLGMAYLAKGRLKDAIPLLRDALDLRKDTLGDDNPATIESMNNLGIAHSELAQASKDGKQLDKAITLFREALELCRTKLSLDHPYTPKTMNNLATAYQDYSRFDEALPLFAGALNLALENLGCSHPDTLSFMDNMASASQDRSAVALAEPILRDCLKKAEKKQPDAWITFNLQSLLGGSLLAQKKFADAEPFLVGGYKGMKQRAAQIPPPSRPRLIAALESTVQLYVGTNQPEEAEKWRTELASVKSNAKLLKN
jgi:eukaryotic-like serine/threonine-protein kinase